MKKLQSTGYALSVIGVALILIWIGIFKFTPTEAEAIKPFMQESPLFAWTYEFFSVQMVSNIIGIIEILTGILLVASIFLSRLGLLAGIFSAITFLITLSFLFTTPGIFVKVDGIWIADFFILKDLMAFGISMMVIGRSVSAHASPK